MTDPSTTEPPSATALSNEAALNSRDMNHPDDDYKGREGKDKVDKKPFVKKDDRQHSNISYNNKNNNAVSTADDHLPSNVQPDPRGNGDILQRMTQKATKRGNGRNTESFDPTSTLVRPDVRVLVGNPQHDKFGKTLKHDDVVVVPELFGAEDDWSLYYKLVEELTALQESHVKGSEFISWHEGSHLICKEPKESPTFQRILKRLCDYFDIDASSAGTRFNWYKDSQDWKVRVCWRRRDVSAICPPLPPSENISQTPLFLTSRFICSTSPSTMTVPPSIPGAPRTRTLPSAYPLVPLVN
jgi:hypothetical protein